MDFLPILHVLKIFLTTIAAVLAIPIMVLLLECMAAFLLPYRHQSAESPKAASYPSVAESLGSGATGNTEDLKGPEVVVLIPAHNEAGGIRRTLDSLLPQVTKVHNIVVVADNCTDDTATIARSYGVTVLERNDLDHRGKGYALDYGVDFLRRGLPFPERSSEALRSESETQGEHQAPIQPPIQTHGVNPDVVFVVDADCHVHSQTLQRAGALAYQSSQPVQVTNTLQAPEAGQLRDRLSSFAFRVHTFVRPNGLARLNLPFTLHGTGMTFPWSVLKDLKLASGNIVEDIQLSLELILKGYQPQFCAEGEVSGMLPQQQAIATQQRTRWEHGHLNTLLTQVPRLLKAAVAERKLKLFAVALDLCVPPLSLLVILWSLPTVLAIAVGLIWSIWLPTFLFLAEGAMLLLAICAAWLRFGRQQLPLTSLLAVPFYILWKLPIYLSFLARPEQTWVRTERE